MEHNKPRIVKKTISRKPATVAFQIELTPSELRCLADSLGYIIEKIYDREVDLDHKLFSKLFAASKRAEKKLYGVQS